MASMLLLVLLSLVAAATATCPAGYQQINGGDCFKLYPNQLAYDNAEAQCVQDGGHLASVHSQAEQNALAAMMGATTPLIGMKCTDAIAGNCRWADGTNNDYSNFVGGAPILAYGSCVHLATTDSLWYSWNCAAPIAGFLCRIPFNAPVTTCTNGYQQYNGGCAALKTTMRSQADAEASCALEGGHLASIHTDADNEFYRNLASGQGLTNNLYVGLQWNTAANTYKWTDDTQYNYQKFANQFPNIVFGECVQMMLSTEFGSQGQWTNIPCTTAMAYACWKASGDTPTKAPAQCPGITFLYDKGSAYSPNFPVSIPAGQTCEYVLATGVGTKVSVKFPVFNTDAASSLSLYDGLDETVATAKLSGNAINPQTEYASATNVMKMVFVASATASGVGWQADFTSTGGPVNPDPEPTFDPVAQCPKQQYTADTMVYSPNYPDAYPPMSDCLYYIQSRDGRKMSLEFTYMDTEVCCDYVVIYDGPSNTSPVLGRVSGKTQTPPKLYYSTGTTLTLEFFSDSNNEGKGWAATVRNL